MTLHRPKDAWAQHCPVRSVLDRLGDRWTVLILHELEAGTLRFSALKLRIGDISQRMLALTLRRLEEDGLLSRKVFPTIPPKVEYSLTPLGRSLLVPLRSMIAWAEQNQAAVEGARRDYVAPAAMVAR